MKRVTPYIFPLIVIAIVFFLVYRWYSLRGQQNAENGQYGEGIEIENLTEDDADSILRGTGNLQTAPLTQDEGSTAQVPGAGAIRYEIQDGRVRFSISADLPDPITPYTVWIRTVGSDNLTQAFTLFMGKGGYMGTAALSEELLPLEVIVSQATNKSEVLDQVILRGTINKQGAGE
jgi:hypothetical protein